MPVFVSFIFTVIFLNCMNMDTFVMTIRKLMNRASR
jgi:hypothetical protein